MKKFLFTVATLCGLCAATAQTGMVTTTIIPLTNQVPFTNTVAPPTDLSTIQLSNVVTLLLTLQTNIEETLPVLDLIQSNAVVVSVMPTNHPLSFVEPITSNPANTLTPTGAASGTNRPQTSLAVKIGTNSFGIDSPTLQGLFVLRVNLQQSLGLLQQLNGTTPTPTQAVTFPLPPLTTTTPPVTNFSPGPLTNTFAPLPNQSSFLQPPASIPS